MVDDIRVPECRHASIYVVIICAAFALAPMLRGQAPATLTADQRRQLDDAIVKEQQRLKIPGLGVAIALNGRLEYVKSAGLADVENSLAVNDESGFRTASLAKPLTATALMQLVESGAIDLDAPIQRYCGAFPAKRWPVTARQLLGHLAGVRHYKKAGESIGTQHYFTIGESLAPFKDDPLVHEPGTKYEYSTYGFSILGCAIEGAAHQSYGPYMQTRIFQPAGMTHTGLDDVYLIVPGRVRGYQLLTQDTYRSLPAAAKAIARPDAIYNAPLHDTSMKTPGGGIVSTPSDYVRFVLALLEGRLVKPATRDAMWTSQKTRGGDDIEYGFGFGVQMRKEGKAVTHGGNQAGASSLLRISPERKAVLVIMTNLEDAPLSPMGSATANVVLNPPR